MELSSTDSKPVEDVASNVVSEASNNLNSVKKERQGLTTVQAEEAYKTFGYNELPLVEVPLWYVFLKQFLGVMPYTMEICVIVAAACQSWPDFGIIIAMVSSY